MPVEREFTMGLAPEFPLNLLLVGENLEIGESCLLALKKARFEIQFNVAGTAKEFVEQLRTENYDVILAPYSLF